MRLLIKRIWWRISGKAIPPSLGIFEETHAFPLDKREVSDRIRQDLANVDEIIRESIWVKLSFGDSPDA